MIGIPPTLSEEIWSEQQDLSGCKKNVLWIVCVVGISIKFCN
jgi:hypothetical protein